MNSQLLKRIQLLESEYLIEPSASIKIVVKFIDPLNANENSLTKVRAGDGIYERMENETENEFVERILNLTNDTLLIHSM
jgi:hypothetical protein